MASRSSCAQRAWGSGDAGLHKNLLPGVSSICRLNVAYGNLRDGGICQPIALMLDGGKSWGGAGTLGDAGVTLAADAQVIDATRPWWSSDGTARRGTHGARRLRRDPVCRAG